LVAVVGALFVLPSPATAYIPGLQTVTTVSAADSDSPKYVTVSCPSGKSVIGTGFTIDGPPGQVSVNRVAPTANSVLVRAVEINGGTKSNWWLRAFAVCASSTLAGLEIVSANTSPGSDAVMGTATCPSGKSTFGTGAAISGTGSGQVMLNSLLPSVSAATASAVETNAGTPQIWMLTTYAICAYYVPGLAHHDVQSFSDSTDKSVAYVCVQKVPVSVGWEIQSRAPGSITASTAMPTVAGSQVAAQEAGSAVTSYWSLLSRTTCVLA
jgi:hypothetical protein